GRRGNEVQPELALETFLYDFHTQQTEKAAAKSETEGHGVFRFVEKCRVVELQLAERVAQRLIFIGEDGEQARKHHWFRGFKAPKRRGSAAGFDDGVAHAGVGDALDVGDDEADVTGFEFFQSDRLVREAARLRPFL